MTIYTLTGLTWSEGGANGDTISGIRSAQFDVGFLGAGSAVTSRQIGTEQSQDGPIPLLAFDLDSYLEVFDGQALSERDGLQFEFFDVTWSTGSNTVLNVTHESPTQFTSYVFTVAGDAFPTTFTSGDETALSNFIEGTTIRAPASGTGFAPGETFNIADLPNVTVTENDDFTDVENNSANVNTGAGNDTVDGADNDDTLDGGAGNDFIIGSAGNDSLLGGLGNDTAQIFSDLGDATISFQGEDILVEHFEGSDPQLYTDTLNGFEAVKFNDTVVSVSELHPVVNETGDADDNMLTGQGNNDRLDGAAGNDTLDGGNGSDTLIGGTGDDMLTGGTSTGDLRDVIYGGAGNDNIDGGYGNDELRGDAGNDVIAGGFGADTVLGGEGNDTLTGSALGDLLFGGDGDDFVNGGFGFDRVNGGAGADEFFHLGVANHGADWIQDYDAGEGDVLVFGNANANAGQFQINVANTAGAGAAGVDEAFVIFKPTGQIMWALVDGDGQDEINLQIGGDVFDLTA